MSKGTLRWGSYYVGALVQSGEVTTPMEDSYKHLLSMDRQGGRRHGGLYLVLAMVERAIPCSLVRGY